MASWRLAWDLLTAITIPLMAEGAGRVLGESCKPEINRESHRKKTMRASGVTSIIRVNLNKLDFLKLGILGGVLMGGTRVELLVYLVPVENAACQRT